MRFDKTERNGEETLQNHPEWLRLATESAGMGIWDIDLKTWKVVWDRKMCELYGLTYGKEKPDKDTWEKFVHPEDRETANGELEKAIDGVSEHYSNKFRIIRADGTIRFIEASANVLYDDNSEPFRIIGVNWDITDQHNLEEEHIQLQKTLYQSQRMESIGQLAGGIAHDFNNLLVPIIGYAEMGRTLSDSNKELLECFVEIEKAGNKAAELTRKILAFSRRQLLEMVPIDLNKIINDFENMLKILLGEDVLLNIDCDDAIHLISGDKSQVEQVILNLAINARDAVDTHGAVTINTRALFWEKEMLIDQVILPPGNYTLLSVEDNGSGIDPSIIENIFEPFFTTKPRERGTGLGLSTVFGIVKQHGGYIFADSTPGEGTVFNIYFEALEEPVLLNGNFETDTFHPRQSQPPAEEDYLILIVEDDEMVKNLISKTLSHNGYRVISAGSAEKALTLFTPAVDLLLADIILPGMDGKSLADSLRKQKEELKILFISGYTEKINMDDRLRGPGEDFLTKPFIPKDLLHTIGRLLKKV